MKIQLLETKYHRNGVCGIGFIAADFIWSDDDYKNVKARAIIFEDDLDSRDKPIRYAITSENVSDCWRGDHFIDQLWKLVSNDLDNKFNQMLQRINKKDEAAAWSP